MSIKLKNDVTCKHVSAETNRFGDQVELRYYDGKLYIYKVGTGNAVGLVGADVAIDSLPKAFHEEKIGVGGSLTSLVMKSELQLNGIDIDDFDELDFANTILSSLEFDAAFNLISIA